MLMQCCERNAAVQGELWKMLVVALLLYGIAAFIVVSYVSEHHEFTVLADMYAGLHQRFGQPLCPP